eukprot:3497946-Alexandrium_andersonii.AAC.1
MCSLKRLGGPPPQRNLARGVCSFPFAAVPQSCVSQQHVHAIVVVGLAELLGGAVWRKHVDPSAWCCDRKGSQHCSGPSAFDAFALEA